MKSCSKVPLETVEVVKSSEFAGGAGLTTVERNINFVDEGGRFFSRVGFLSVYEDICTGKERIQVISLTTYRSPVA